MNNASERAVEKLDEIAEERRGRDDVTSELLGTMRERTETVAKEVFYEKETATLRGFLDSLDLHFDPEEFIETEDTRECPPEVIGLTVYLDLYPKTIDRFTREDLYQDYLYPYTDMTDDEYFMMTEYVDRYYE